MDQSLTGPATMEFGSVETDGVFQSRLAELPTPVGWGETPPTDPQNLTPLRGSVDRQDGVAVPAASAGRRAGRRRPRTGLDPTSAGLGWVSPVTPYPSLPLPSGGQRHCAED